MILIHFKKSNIFNSLTIVLRLVIVLFIFPLSHSLLGQDCTNSISARDCHGHNRTSSRPFNLNTSYVWHSPANSIICVIDIYSSCTDFQMRSAGCVEESKYSGSWLSSTSPGSAEPFERKNYAQMGYDALNIARLNWVLCNYSATENSSVKDAIWYFTRDSKDPTQGSQNSIVNTAISVVPSADGSQDFMIFYDVDESVYATTQDMVRWECASDLTRSLGNLVWIDANDNGMYDGGEQGINNVTVYLYLDEDGDGNPDGASIRQTTTDASGNYSFNNLPERQFIVGIEVPANYNVAMTTANSNNPLTTDNDNNGVTLSGGILYSNTINLTASSTSVDFGLVSTACTISYTQTQSACNNNGTPSAPGDDYFTIDVNASATNGGSQFQVVLNANADGTGGTVLATSNYDTTITVGTPMTFDADGSTTYNLTVRDATTNTCHQDFTTTTVASCSNTCALTISQNTQSVCNDNGTNTNPSDDYFTIAINATAVNGGSQFEVVQGANADGTGGTVLATSNYGTAVTVGTPTTFDADGSTTYNLTVRDATTNTCHQDFTTTTVASCSNEPPKVAVGNYVFLDNDLDGIFTTGDTAISDVVIQLFHADSALTGTPMQETTTDINGYYYFDQLDTGRYILFIPDSMFNVGKPLQNLQSAKGTGTGAIAETVDDDDNGRYIGVLTGRGVGTTTITLTANGEPTGESGAGAGQYPGTLPDSSVNETIDFGFMESVAIGNLVYNDLNCNGKYDTGDTGIQGVELKLYKEGAILPKPERTATTGADGSYAFDNLAPGRYFVAILSGEFTTGEPLEGLTSVLGGGNSETIDDNADGNGRINTSFYNYLTSGIIDVKPNEEPTSEAGLNAYSGTLPDENVNLTVDFALIDSSVCVTPTYDWGDLPDLSAATGNLDYQTTLDNNGPRHQIITGLSLGTTVDEETNGQQSSDALGDGADEDGFSFPTTLDLILGGQLKLPINVTNTTNDTAHLEIWIDWNGDGDFEDNNEMVADLSDDSTGDFSLNYIPINIPTNAIQEQMIGFRARLSHTDNMTPYGQVESGEIEDYLIIIHCKSAVCPPISTLLKKGGGN